MWLWGELLHALSTRSTQLNLSALSASPRLCVRYLEAARRRFPQSNGLSNPLLHALHVLAYNLTIFSCYCFRYWEFWSIGGLEIQTCSPKLRNSPQRKQYPIPTPLRTLRSLRLNPLKEDRQREVHFVVTICDIKTSFLARKNPPFRGSSRVCASFSRMGAWRRKGSIRVD